MSRPTGRIVWYVSHVSQYGRAELRFRAETAGGDRIAESLTFKGDAAFGPNPRLDEHRAALDDLLERLREKSWRATSADSDAWYGRRLEPA